MSTKLIKGTGDAMRRAISSNKFYPTTLELEHELMRGIAVDCNMLQPRG